MTTPEGQSIPSTEDADCGTSPVKSRARPSPEEIARRLGEQEGRPLQEIGDDPDPRFTFANERTFLAWNRTALALIAAGLAAAQLLKFHPQGLRLIIALPLIGLGAITALTSYRHWQTNERALRLRLPLRYSALTRGIALVITVVALAATALAIIDAAR